MSDTESDRPSPLLAGALLVLAGALPACRGSALVEPTEARAEIARIARAAVTHARTQKLPPIFPISADWTPRASPCASPARAILVDEGTWQTSPWLELHYTLPRPTRFQLRVTRSGSSPRERYLVEARGEPRCDGKIAHMAIMVDGDLHVATLE